MIFATIYIVLCMIFIAFLGGMIVGAWIFSFENPEQEPCASCEYTEGSPWCIEHCPHDIESENKEMSKIKALEQNSSDDVISRELVKYEYRRRFKENLTDNARGIDLTKYADSICKEFNAFIDSIPSINPTKTGHWIMPVQDDGMSEPIYYQVRCSECGFDLDPQTWHMELHQYSADKFCPNCGARMMESEE